MSVERRTHHTGCMCSVAAAGVFAQGSQLAASSLSFAAVAGPVVPAAVEQHTLTDDSPAYWAVTGFAGASGSNTIDGYVAYFAQCDLVPVEESRNIDKGFESDMDHKIAAAAASTFDFGSSGAAPVGLLNLVSSDRWQLAPFDLAGPS